MTIQDEPLTLDGFRRLIEGKRQIALSMIDDADFRREAWVACGFAAECALKARILQLRGYNCWPVLQAGGLHTHSIRRLIELAEIDLRSLPRELQVSFRVTMDWSRGHDYNPSVPPEPVVRDMYEAVFGGNGVVQWLL